MKIAAVVTEDALQFNLQHETEAERLMLTVMAKAQGKVTIHEGVEIGMSRGGFVRNFGERQGALTITITKESKP